MSRESKRRCLAPGCGADLSLADHRRKFCSDACKAKNHRLGGGGGGAPADPAKPEPTEDQDVPDVRATKARQAAVELELKQVQLAQAKAELAVTMGELVGAAAVEARFSRFSTELRTKMLGSPSRSRGYLPPRFNREDVADAVAAFERAQRELLEEAAVLAESGDL